MVQTARWLANQVGEGNVFTSQQLRQAVSGRSQVDRRMRDLRKFGWVIEETRDSPELRPGELRLARIGIPVWDPAARRQANPPAVSNKLRKEVLFRDNHACVRCGAAAGEYFSDMPTVKVRLTLAHTYPGSLRAAVGAGDFVTACQRCNEAVQQQTDNYLNAEQVIARIRQLGLRDKQRLKRRMETNTRETDAVDEYWRAYLQLPAVDKDRVRQELDRLLGVAVPGT